MPAVIDRADRRLLIISSAFLFLLVVALVMLTPEERRRAFYPSSYSPASGGAKAAFLALKESGYEVERWEKSPLELPAEAGNVVYVLAEPFAELERGEKDAILRFIAAGGRVLAMGSRSGILLPRDRAAYSLPERYGWREYDPEIPTRLSSAGRIGMEDAATWRTGGSDVEHYAAGEAGGVVISYPHGHGDVVWWGSSTPITNAGVSREGNFQLLLNSIGGKDRRILWDEYFHGRRRSLWSYAAATPVKWALAQCAVLLLAVLLTFSRRNGPVRPLPRESRLSTLEFVETLGGLYRHAQATPVAVEIMYTRFRYLLTRRLGLKSDAPAEQLARAARERLGYNHPDFPDTLRRSELAMRAFEFPEGEAVALVQKLNEHARALKLIPRRQEEKN
jgi:hypothetical protein